MKISIKRMVIKFFKFLSQKISDMVYVYDLRRQSKRVARLYLKEMEKTDKGTAMGAFGSYRGFSIGSEPDQYSDNVKIDYPAIVKQLILTSATADVIVNELYKRGATPQQINDLLMRHPKMKQHPEHIQLFEGAFNTTLPPTTFTPTIPE